MENMSRRNSLLDRLLQTAIPTGHVGSQESQEHRAKIISNTQGDADGWVLWADKPPPIDVEVECKNGDDIYRVIPRKQSLGWNVYGVYWRAL